MAISDELDAIKKKGKGATAPEGEAKKKAGATGNTATAQFKASGQAARAGMSDDQKAIEGSKSDKVAFVCALGDPNKKQTRVEGGQAKDSYTVVGYKFQALEDCTVPVAPLKKGFKHLADVGEFSEKQVKAGETIVCNLVEAGAFISKIEYAGKFTGNGEPVGLSAKCSASREVPLPILRRLTSSGSIKDNMELIADMVGADGTNKGTPQIKPEYAETFGVLYEKRGKVTKPGKGAKAAEATEDIAAAFRAFYGM